MTSEAELARPPRLATWLVNLFASGQAGESILGDLLEEYSHLASKSGVAVARRWYWRQIVKTIAHLAVTAFRIAPWATTAAVVGGFLLLKFCLGWQERAIFAVLDRYRVFDRHFSIYALFASYGMWIAHLIFSMLVGCTVALAAKGREMVATTTLSIVLFLMVGVAYFSWVASHWPVDFALGWLLFQCSSPFAIMVGGVIVRMHRAGAAARPSGA